MVVGEFTRESELVVVGGGPGGYSAAFRAAELGVQTILVDLRGELGGTSLPAGCIPSKMLRQLGELLRMPKRSAEMGITFSGEPAVDLGQVRRWVAASVRALADGLAARARELGIEVMTGRAVFEDAKNLTVQGSGAAQRIKFRRAVVATGLGEVRLGEVRLGGGVVGGGRSMFSAFDESRVMSVAAALGVPRIPERLLVVVGSAGYGIELAGIYAALGSAVTVVGDGFGAGDWLLGGLDEDLLRVLVRGLTQECGISVALAAEVCGAVPAGMSGVRVEFGGENPLAESIFDGVIAATAGRVAVEGLGLARAGVEVDDATGYVVVDGATLQTSNPRIFAVGDVTGPPLVASRAIHQGRVAGELVGGMKASVFEARAIPQVIFTEPPVAWCGLTERQAEADGIAYRVAKFSGGMSGQTVGLGQEREGLTKILYEAETQLVLGVGMVGSGAAELISTGVLALEMGAEIGDLAAVVFPHPTRSELLGEAAGQSLNW